MIGLRMAPKDMDLLQAYANAEVRSLASFARMLVLRGLAQYEAERVHPPKSRRR